jgi:hypothetical protein
MDARWSRDGTTQVSRAGCGTRPPYTVTMRTSK